jgi:hypothetical protein
MIKIAFDLDLVARQVLLPTLGLDVTSHLENDVRPVKAVVVDPWGGGGPGDDWMSVVEVTFVDGDHAWEWMNAEGMDVDDMDWHLGRWPRPAVA